VSAEPSLLPSRPRQRAAEIQAAVQRTAARCSEVPVVETVALRLLVVLGREISSLLEQVLRPHGLNETEFRTLMLLFSHPEGHAHPGSLCAAAAQSPANMTRVADGLCARGLITRVASEQDRRRTVLRITPTGEALARTLLPQTVAHTRSLFEPMPPAARQALLEQLQALLARIDHRPQVAR
jgi:MarR family transcriptional repressor of emrRAB